MNKTQATRPCTKNGVFSINRNNIEVDSISSLPDELLTHIFSFLSTKEVVQTCVLSKRWQNTWATVPVLNIHIKEFQNNRSGSQCYEEQRMSMARFERFMTGFLDNRARTILERVCCIHNTVRHIGWLNRVALHMPLLIDIIISGGPDDSLDMSDLVFSCASLQHLSMALYTSVKTIIRPVSLNLPSLKSLELSWVEVPDDFAQKLFVGCPSLVRLKLWGCHLYCSGISSEVLKELSLSKCLLYEQMQISCPALISLDMMIILKGFGISLKNMSSLVNADVKLFGYFSDDLPVLNLFGGLSNVTNLELHHMNFLEVKEQLEKDIPNGRNFNNLKKLVIGGWNLSYDFYLIACLLKRSPNIKELNLLLLDKSQGQIQEPRQDVSGDVLFQCEYLETVKICNKSRYKLSSELINAVIKTLGIYVKKIGNMIIV